MARTHQKVRFLPKGKQKHTVRAGEKGVEDVLRILEGRWKLVILFHLFGGHVRRFSELRRAIPAVSEKMLIQQLRQMELDGIIRRFVHHQVPPKVEYSLTDWGQALCPALDALLDRKSTRLNSSHQIISYAVFCLKKKKKNKQIFEAMTHTFHLVSSH